MSPDVIIQEIRKRREEYARSLGYDLRAIYLDLKKRQEESEREKVALKPRRVAPARR
jgi:hypothetical protein